MRTGAPPIDAGLVGRLITAQFPQWAHLPIAPVEVSGWDNRTFRLGNDQCVRLPSADWYALQVDKEQRWLPILAPQLPLPVPAAVARGVPGVGYPYSWSVLHWVGRLAAVIDFGTSGVGDPACDVVIAWTLLSGESRAAFRSALAIDPATWARGRGWALWKSVITLAGDLDGDAEATATARHTLEQVLADHAGQS